MKVKGDSGIDHGRSVIERFERIVLSIPYFLDPIT